MTIMEFWWVLVFFATSKLLVHYNKGRVEDMVSSLWTNTGAQRRLKSWGYKHGDGRMQHLGNTSKKTVHSNEERRDNKEILSLWAES